MQGKHPHSLASRNKWSLKDSFKRLWATRWLSRRDFLKTSAQATAVVTGISALSTQSLTPNARAASTTMEVVQKPMVDIWNLPAFTPASGPFQPDWNSIAQQYRIPEWFRDAKFGIWQHWDPQSVPEYGDWYARGMYQQGSSQYNYHVAHYGHPSKFGYKDITHLFTASQWDPDALVKLYVQQGGAKYFVALANHHDDFDNWNSAYQPWNSTVVGPKKDVIGLWAQSARKYGVPFGVTVHACPGPSWDVFMPVRYDSDSTGSLAGVHYDGWTTAADGTGQWWQGMDPVDLNGPVHQADSTYTHSDSSPFVRQFYYRTDDLLTKYQPDLIYFDNGLAAADDWNMPDQAKVMAANFYNKSLQWNGGALKAVINLKRVPANWQSALVEDLERTTSSSIQNYAWQSDTSLGDWHYYAPSPFNMTAPQVIQSLVDIVSNNGNLLLNVPQHGDGHLDQQAIQIVQDIGAWLSVNGEGIYGSRPFAISTENTVRYTRKGSVLYATALSWPQNNSLVLTTLNKKSPYIGNVTQVELLGHGGTLSFTQDNTALTITTPAGVPSSAAYAFKITQNKLLVNCDDAGLIYSGPGWSHQANRGIGDSNNNVWSTTNNGDAVSYTFTGIGIQYISETYTDEGNVDVYIDGTYQKTVSGYSAARKAQVVLYSNLNLSAGQHTIKLVKTSGTYMLLDAFKVFPTTTVKIVNRNSGLLLDVTGQGKATGVAIQQWQDYSPSVASSEWQLVDAGGGYFTIVNRNSNLVLDVSGGSTANGGSVIQWSSNGGTNQQWQLVDTGDGYVTIVNRNSNLLLDVSGGSTANGGSVIQWSSNGGANQQWQIVAA
ncbi:MAG: alpha-L-fucosidase [Ktedonobacteraceae bacterium]|nr:alpha-L-fucosidase [Ktedonobacteraceae bacterium]